MYRQGIWADTPDGFKQPNFRKMVRQGAHLEEKHGSEILKHKNFNRVWSPDKKSEPVSQIIAGNSTKAAALQAGIDSELLHQGVRKYRQLGYNGIVSKLAAYVAVGINDSGRKEVLTLEIGENESSKYRV